MTPKEFYNAVVEMRRLQKLYEQSKSPFVEQDMNKAVMAVDNEISRVEKIELKKRTPSLFSDESHDTGYYWNDEDNY